MLNTPDPIPFAQRWIEAWNARDVEAVLVDFADDVVFKSPTARRVVPESGGTIQGKSALRNYWIRALTSSPALRFTLVDVYAGMDTIVINFRNESGGLGNEVLTFREGLIVYGRATHLQQERAATPGASPAA